MVNLLGRCCSALFKALLTQWVCLYISVTNPFPRSAVLLVDIKCSCESVILPCNQLLMFLTIPTVCKPWAVRICTTLLWFMWHKFLLSGIIKALQISLQGFLVSLSILIISYYVALILSHLLSSSTEQ